MAIPVLLIMVIRVDMGTSYGVFRTLRIATCWILVDNFLTSNVCIMVNDEY